MAEGSKISVAVTQMACGDDRAANIDRAEALVRKAAGMGAQVVLLQELFETPYFCKTELPDFFDLAMPVEGNPTIARFQRLAAELKVVIPFSFFERTGQAHFNSLVAIDADGAILGLYRKSHIPDGPGYEEKYYFSPGDTGFKVFDTAYGRIGIGICWDQWFPEAARAMALQGAELLLYPTAIGSEPPAPGYDSQPHWERVMCGHAGANLMPLAASNRIGSETSPDGTSVTFYGSSFIADWTGKVIERASRDEEEVRIATFDFDEIARFRRSWGLFRDRRPELYSPLGSLDGTS
ncbi:MAG: N-carbamoylputrescine amidase [Hyphomicrobiales bacterium]|nr:MAG: N-carbamoylputrescine amidase [Hyphomicrobiales bacterium]